MNAKTVGVGLQAYSYHSKTSNENKNTRFSGSERSTKSPSAQVLFGFNQAPETDQFKALEDAALSSRSPIQQLIYRIANGGTKR